MSTVTYREIERKYRSLAAILTELEEVSLAQIAAGSGPITVGLGAVKVSPATFAGWVDDVLLSQAVYLPWDADHPGSIYLILEPDRPAELPICRVHNDRR